MYKYISLGPSCISASILKDSKNRIETFGFDWCRSGSIHIKDFFDMSLDEFLIKHVYSPNIQLEQLEAPSSKNNYTPIIKQKKSDFGYDYLINPHRNYRDSETRRYLRRSFSRLKETVSDKQIHKVFLLADYMNKEHYVYFHNVKDILQQIENILSSIENFSIVVIRIKLEREVSLGVKSKLTDLSNRSNLLEISVNEIMDDERYRSKLHCYIMKEVKGIRR